MNRTYNIYCDESCHLENDKIPVMVLGAIWCPLTKRGIIADQLREIKVRNGFSPNFEIKWTKVSPGGIQLYTDIINYFFNEEHLNFRVLIVPDKSAIDHITFDQDHDTWYYKMFFNLLKVLFNPHDRYRIYLDIKDTHSYKKIEELHNVLCNNMYDFNQ
ncbi:MAG: hypothetical protein P9M15_06865 [Candidatus Electryoneaceae bacterium]|nr:hypothetical protein [Candidatus Electryoneaceae bacterium]